MIRITERKCGVLIKGHAMYAPEGKDIVCAGVTALAESLLLSLDELTSAEPDFVMEKGFIKLEIRNETKEARLLLRSFFVGAENIAQQFPEYAQVTRLESH